MLSLYISNIIVVIIFLSYGSVINYIIFSNSKKLEVNTENILFGAIYIGFIALFINFFLPLGKFLNNSIILIGFLFFFYLIKKNNHNKKIFKIIIVITSISF